MARRKALEVIEFFKAIYYTGIDNEKVWTQIIRLLAFRQAVEVMIEFFNGKYYKLLKRRVWAQRVYQTGCMYSIQQVQVKFKLCDIRIGRWQVGKS